MNLRADHFWLAWQFWLLVLTVMPWVFFVVRYAQANWRAQPVGRALMLAACSIVGALLNAVAGWIWPSHENVRWVVFIIMLGGVCIAGWYLYRNLLRELNRPPQAHPSRRAGDGATRVHDSR